METSKTRLPHGELIEKLKGTEGYRGLSILDENLQEIHREGNPTTQAQELALKHLKTLLDIDAPQLGLAGPRVAVLSRPDERILLCRSEGKLIILTTTGDARVASFVDMLIKL